jgi:hypothetical protein
MNHITDEDLECYHLGMVTDEAELAQLEEHYLGCPECARRAEEAADSVDAIRAGLITGNFDLELEERIQGRKITPPKQGRKKV